MDGTLGWTLPLATLMGTEHRDTGGSEIQEQLLQQTQGQQGCSPREEEWEAQLRSEMKAPGRAASSTEMVFAAVQIVTGTASRERGWHFVSCADKETLYLFEMFPPGSAQAPQSGAGGCGVPHQKGQSWQV